MTGHEDLLAVGEAGGVRTIFLVVGLLVLSIGNVALGGSIWSRGWYLAGMCIGVVGGLGVVWVIVLWVSLW